jgi:hypothetical protein
MRVSMKIKHVFDHEEQGMGASMRAKVLRLMTCSPTVHRLVKSRGTARHP